MTTIRRTTLQFLIAGQDGLAQEGAKITVTLSSLATDTLTGAVVLPETQIATTSQSGEASFQVWPNGDSGTYYLCSIVMPDQTTRTLPLSEKVVVPDTPTVRFSDIRGSLPPPPLDASTRALQQVLEAAAEVRAAAAAIASPDQLQSADGVLAFAYTDGDEVRTGYIAAAELASILMPLMAPMLDEALKIVRAESVEEVEGGILARLPVEAQGLSVRATTLGATATTFLVGAQRRPGGMFLPGLSLSQAEDGVFMTGFLLS